MLNPGVKIKILNSPRPSFDGIFVPLLMREGVIGTLAILAGACLLCTVVLNAPGQEGDEVPVEETLSTFRMPAMHGHMQVPPLAILIQRQRESEDVTNNIEFPLDPDDIVVEAALYEDEEASGSPPSDEPLEDTNGNHTEGNVTVNLSYSGYTYSSNDTSAPTSAPTGSPTSSPTGTPTMFIGPDGKEYLGYAAYASSVHVRETVQMTKADDFARKGIIAQEKREKLEVAAKKDAAEKHDKAHVIEVAAKEVAQKAIEEAAEKHKAAWEKWVKKVAKAKADRETGQKVASVAAMEKHTKAAVQAASDKEKATKKAAAAKAEAASVARATAKAAEEAKKEAKRAEEEKTAKVKAKEHLKRASIQADQDAAIQEKEQHEAKKEAKVDAALHGGLDTKINSAVDEYKLAHKAKEAKTQAEKDAHALQKASQAMASVSDTVDKLNDDHKKERAALHAARAKNKAIAMKTLAEKQAAAEKSAAEETAAEGSEAVAEADKKKSEIEENAASKASADASAASKEKADDKTAADLDAAKALNDEKKAQEKKLQAEVDAKEAAVAEKAAAAAKAAGLAKKEAEEKALAEKREAEEKAAADKAAAEKAAADKAEHDAEEARRLEVAAKKAAADKKAAAAKAEADAAKAEADKIAAEKKAAADKAAADEAALDPLLHLDVECATDGSECLEGHLHPIGTGTNHDGPKQTCENVHHDKGPWISAEDFVSCVYVKPVESETNSKLDSAWGSDAAADGDGGGAGYGGGYGGYGETLLQQENTTDKTSGAAAASVGEAIADAVSTASGSPVIGVLSPIAGEVARDAEDALGGG